MSASTLPKVTIGVLNYNGAESLPAVLDSLVTLSWPSLAVLIVDNASTDGSREWLQHRQAESNGFECIYLPVNNGSAAGRNAILQHATTDYILMLDNDITVTPDALSRLMQVMCATPGLGACHPEIEDPDDPMAYHYNGGWIHYLGAHIARPRPIPGQPRPGYEAFDTVSGAALLIRRETAQAIGGFDSDYFFNWEDGDFTTRLTLAGYRCVNVPGAVVRHRSKPRGTSKVFYQVRNRWYFMLKLYSWRTLLLGLPMLCVFEVIQAAFLIRKGALADYLRGNAAAVAAFSRTMVKRRAFQRLKVVRDRDWLHAGEIYVPASLVSSRLETVLKRLCGGGFGLYWKLIRQLC